MQPLNSSPFWKHLIWIILSLSAVTGGVFTVLALHTTMLSYFPYSQLLGFTDGYTYAAIAHNLANGVGHLWAPQYGLCRFHVFFDHPALGLGMQALFFKAFGTHWYTERIFCLFIYLVTMVLICFLWKQQHLKTTRWLFWLPLLFWLLFAFNLIAYVNNSLEPVSALFSLLAVIFLVYSNQFTQVSQVKSLICLAFAATALVTSLLINGLLSLFVLCVDAALYLAYKKHSIKFHSARTFILFLFSALFLLLLFYFIPRSLHNYLEYLKIQLIPALQGQRQDSTYFGWHHFSILRVWLANAILPLAVAGLLTVILKKPVNWKKNKTAYFYAILTLVSLLPITLSSKQFFHYSLHTNIYFLLFLLAFITQPIGAAVNEVSVTTKRYGYALAVSALIFLSCLLVFAFYLFRPIPLGKFAISARKIHQVIGKEKKLSIRGDSYLDHNPSQIESIMQRNYAISWCPHADEKFLLQLDPNNKNKIPGYHLIKSDFIFFQLYQRNN